MDHTLLVPSKQSIVFLPKRFGLAIDVDGAFGSTHDFLRLGFSKKIHFSSITIQCKNDFLLYLSSKISHMFLRLSICLSFNSCGTHLPTFWIFLISRRRLETACWLTLNCSASCFCVCESSSSSNVCNSTSSYFLDGFPCLQHRNLQFWNAETIVHTFFTMEYVHHKLLRVIGMIPQQFSSNENKKLMLSANAPYLVQMSSY